MSTPDGSGGLPPALLDELFRILYGSPERRLEQLAALRAAHPHCAVAIDDHVACADAEAAAAAAETRLLGNGESAWQPRRIWSLGPGVVFAGHRIIAELGSGGMGSVFAVERVADGRRAALKVLHQEVLDRPDARKRFAREAQALARLRHAGICEILEHGTLDGCPYLVMRRVDGATLAERLAAARIAGDDGVPHEPLLPAAMVQGLLADRPATGVDAHDAAVLALVERLAEALHCAHEGGVVHRDVKPGNVLLEANGHPVLVDFGLAAHAAADTLTASGELLGTPAYMAPERIRGTREPDARGDVYALGVLLYECLGLRLPFLGASHGELLRAITAATPPPLLRELRPRLPADVDRVVATAMDRDPSCRYGTARELAEELARVRRGEPVRARRPSWRRATRDWIERNRTFSFATALGVLTAAVLFGLVVDVSGRQREADLLATSSFVAMARRAEQALWPATPDREGAFVAWLRRFANDADPDSLPSRLGKLEQACGISADTALAEERAAALARRRAELDDERAALQRLDAVRSPVAMSPQEIEDYRQRRAAWLDQEAPAAAPTPTRPRTRTAHHSALLTTARYLLDGADVPHAHGALRRVHEGLAWARRVRQETVEAPGADWRRAVAALASGKAPYTTPIELQPQLGLVPLGPDPVSGLEEFAVAISGSVPTRGGDRRLQLRADTAIVLVLVPGGSATIGTTTIDRTLEVLAFPAHRVTLAPFLLGKHEITRRQWRALGGGEPSRLPTGKAFFGESVDDLHPVENVSVDFAREVLQRHGLVLPTEAQWEYAARAGQNVAEVRAMVRDRRENSAGGERGHRPLPPFVADDRWDGHVLPTPVGAHAANPFGLHDCGGNVSEWCDDVFGPYWFPARKGDGRRLTTWGTLGAVRGPNFVLNAEVHSRMPIRTDVRLPVIGVRAARPLE